MTWSAASIGRLMHGIAVVAFPVAVLTSVVRGRPSLGLEYCLDAGLMASVAVLIALAPVAVRRGRARPLVLGFVTAGCAAAAAYIGLCASFPDVMARPLVYYINEIEPRFMDADTLELYSVSLVVRGLIMGVPQGVLALCGGLLAQWIVRRKLGEGAARSGRALRVGRDRFDAA